MYMQFDKMISKRNLANLEMTEWRYWLTKSANVTATYVGKGEWNVAKLGIVLSLFVYSVTQYRHYFSHPYIC